MFPATPHRDRYRPVLAVVTVRDLQVHIAQAGRVRALPRDLVGTPFREALHDGMPGVQPPRPFRVQLPGAGGPVQVTPSQVRPRRLRQIAPADSSGTAMR